MKTTYSLVFFVLLVLLVAAIFFSWNVYYGARSRTLNQVLKCHDDIIDDSIFNLDAKTTLIGAMISFDKLPLPQLTKDKLAALGIVLDDSSQIFDISSYLIARIPTASLCALSQLPGVTSIFIPENDNED